MRIILIVLLFMGQSVIASPVMHTHGDRKHTHLLPSQGIKHRHRNGPLGLVKQNHNESRILKKHDKRIALQSKSEGTEVSMKKKVTGKSYYNTKKKMTLHDEMQKEMNDNYRKISQKKNYKEISTIQLNGYTVTTKPNELNCSVKRLVILSDSRDFEMNSQDFISNVARNAQLSAARNAMGFNRACSVFNGTYELKVSEQTLYKNSMGDKRYAVTIPFSNGEKRYIRRRLVNETKHLAELQFSKGFDFYYKKQYSRAYEYFAKGARNGHKGSQYSLGKMYEEGLGVSKSKEKALSWFKKAALQGHSEAKNRFKYLSELK